MKSLKVVKVQGGRRKIYLLATTDILKRELRGHLQIVSRLLDRKCYHYLKQPLIPGITVKRVYVWTIQDAFLNN